MNKILKFEADWCNPCKKLTIELEGLDFPIDRINVESSPELTNKYMIRSVPTLVFIKDNEEVDRITGFVSKDKVENTISNIYQELG